MGAAETGSGKTLAFGLPMLTGIINLRNSKNEIQPEENSEDDLSENEIDEENMNLSEEGDYSNAVMFCLTHFYFVNKNNFRYRICQVN